MDAVMKEKWANALESGQYQQGTGCLRDSNNRFCCLGVLCDLHGGEWLPNNFDEKMTYMVNAKTLGHNTHLPTKINEEYGIDADTEAELIRMNDGDKSFKEIAQWIRENL